MVCLSVCPCFSSADRELVAWNGGDSGEELELQGDTKGWCQFSDQANIGVKSTFNMDAYTSKLDVKKSRYTEEDANRIAREIEAEQKSRPSALDDSGVCLVHSVRMTGICGIRCLMMRHPLQRCRLYLQSRKQKHQKRCEFHSQMLSKKESQHHNRVPVM